MSHTWFRGAGSARMFSRTAGIIPHVVAFGGLASLAVAMVSIAAPHRGHIDELYWIGSAYYWELLKHPGIGQPQDWRLLPARENPPVARYAIGLALDLAGQRVENLDLLANFYLRFAHVQRAWGDDEESQGKRLAVAKRASAHLLTSYSRGALPGIDPHLLWPARRLMAVLAIATSWLLFCIGSRAFGTVAGVVAGGIFLAHPLSRAGYAFAMSDMVALFLTTAAIHAALLCVNAPWSWRRSLSFAMVSGVLLGLACGAKMNAIVGLATIVGLVIATALRASLAEGTRSRTLRAAASLAAGLPVALIVFVAVNPALHDSLGRGFFDLFEEHRLTAVIQAAFTGVPPLSGVAAKVAAVAGLVGGWPPVFILPAGAALALVPAIRRGCIEAAGIAIWWCGAVVLVTAWIPSPTDRYALPVVPPCALLVGMLAAWLVRYAATCTAQLAGEWRRRRGHRPTAASEAR